MSDIKFSDEAKAIMEQFLSRFPVAIRESYRNKTMKGVEYQLLKHGCIEVAKDLLLEAIEGSLEKSFEPVILGLKDPKKLSDIAASQKEVNKENPVVKVRRWDIPKVKLDSPVKSVVALLAGPRKGGNTDCIMDALLEGVRDSGCSVDKLYISSLNISPCAGCMACEAKELETYCAIKDDMTDLYDKFLKCDAFVMGFPVYTARECSQAATFFDRLKALRSKGQYQKLGRQRRGALVVTWGWPREDSYNHVVENAIFILKLFGVDTAEVVTGSGFWEAYYKKGMARLDENGLAQAKEAGRTLVSG
jgi:multimeric flavodoxin WrbA